MNKKVLLLASFFALLLCGCESEHERIDVFGKHEMRDGYVIDLKDGYWVKDFEIDYDNMQVILNLEVEE